MDLPSILLLIAAGVAGGTMSSLVGGAAMFTFPALMAVGLSPVTATAVNLLSLTPGNMVAAFDDRRQLPPFDRSFVAMVAASVVGAGAGALLLLATPEKAFASLIPALLGFATILFALSGRIGGWLAARAKALPPPSGPHQWSRSLPALLPVSFYGGYFGAGVGVLLLAVLSVGTKGDYRAANATKNFVTSLNSFVAACVFMAQGVIDWPPTFAMASGALVGGFLGGRLGQVMPRWIARSLVIAVGAVLTVAFARRYWF